MYSKTKIIYFKKNVKIRNRFNDQVLLKKVQDAGNYKFTWTQ